MKILIKLVSIILFPFLVGISLPEPRPELSEENSEELKNPDHIQGAFTGGFGEETCRSCHFDYDLNPEGGSLTAEGISDTFKPGERYQVSVTVESERLEVGGFQMTARFEDGAQAGSFEWEGDRLMFTPSVPEELEYIQHSRSGVEPAGKREVSWTFTWIAPKEAPGPVIFNIAANAGNDDDSSFGDWIYAKEITSDPQ